MLASRCKNSRLWRVRTLMESFRKILAEFGRQLSLEEQKDFLQRRYHMGAPRTPEKSGERGRPSTRTQYDDAVARRRGLYHKLVRLPVQATKGGAATHASTAPTRERIKELAIRLSPTVPRRKLAMAIHYEWERLRESYEPTAPAVRSIRAVLRAMGL